MLIFKFLWLIWFNCISSSRSNKVDWEFPSSDQVTWSPFDSLMMIYNRFKFTYPTVMHTHTHIHLYINPRGTHLIVPYDPFVPIQFDTIFSLRRDYSSSSLSSNVPYGNAGMPWTRDCKKAIFKKPGFQANQRVT